MPRPDRLFSGGIPAVMIHPVTSLTALAVFGATLGIFAGLIGAWAIETLTGFSFPHSYFIYTVVIAAGVIHAMFASWRRTLKTSHVGVLRLFGQRIRRFVFTEGTHGVLPGILDFEEGGVSVLEKTKEVKKVIVFTKMPDTVVALFDEVKVQYQVVDPYYFLSTGTSVVEDGIDGLTRNVMSIVAGRLTFNKLLSLQDKMKGALLCVLTPGISDPRSVKAYGISDDMDRRTARWGIDALGVLIPSPRLDDEVQKDIQKVRREAAQRHSQRIETAHLIELVNSLTSRDKPIRVRMGERELTVSIDRPLTPEAAALFVQTQQGKVTRVVDEKRIVITDESGAILKDVIVQGITAWKRGV